MNWYLFNYYEIIYLKYSDIESILKNNILFLLAIIFEFERYFIDIFGNSENEKFLEICCFFLGSCIEFNFDKFIYIKYRIERI
jgi:hypothetical protein